MKKWRRIGLLLLVGGILALLPGTAMAETDEDEEEKEIGISSVSLRVESNIRVGGSSHNVNVTAGSGLFSVDDVDVVNMPKRDWEAGDRPEIRVTLEAENGYYFPSGFSKSDVSVSGSGTKATAVTGKYSTLWVDIELKELTGSSTSSDESDDYYGKINDDSDDEDDDEWYDEDDDEWYDDDDDEYDGDYDLEVADAEWDTSEGVAYWEESADARKYEVRLYRAGRTASATVTTSNSRHDFSEDITRSGEYTFRVRGVYNSSNKGEWEESDTWDVSSSDVDSIQEHRNSQPSGSGGSGAWLKDTVGWWYCNADKSYTISNWQYIDGKWYYFNEKGYMATGWISWNGKWYYCEDSGAMLASTTTPDGFYVGEDGVWEE